MVCDAIPRDPPAATRAWIEAARGELRRSEDLAHEVLGDNAATTGATAEAHLALGIVAWARDRLVDAGTELDAALAAAERAERAGIATLVRLEHALVASSAGDHLTAIGTVVDVDRRLREECRTSAFRSVVDGVDACVHLAAGDVARAEVLAERLPDGTDRTLLAARVGLARGRVDEARARLEEVLRHDDLDRRQRIDALILASRADEACGEHGSARRRRRALTALTVPEGHVRAYRDHGVEPPAESGAPAASGPTWFALSEREQQVLRHLRDRRDNREIGEAMYISINTVKTHLQSLYRKLGVSSRRQAVERATDLGLL